MFSYGGVAFSINMGAIASYASGCIYAYRIELIDIIFTG